LPKKGCGREVPARLKTTIFWEGDFSSGIPDNTGIQDGCVRTGCPLVASMCSVERMFRGWGGTDTTLSTQIRPPQTHE
jgi:hypothetical protein